MFIKGKQKLDSAKGLDRESNGHAQAELAGQQAAAFPVRRMVTPGPRARALLARDAQVVSQAHGRPYPLVVAEGHGAQLTDVDGNRYIDFIAGIAVNATGHAHPRVVAAVQQQAARFLHVSADFYHEPWVQLAERLNSIRPFAEPARSFMCNSGTEAVEAALKLARYHSKRENFIGFLGGFHGRTAGALSFTSSRTVQRRGYAMMPGVTHIPYPDAYRPVLAAQPGDADYGETVINYLERVIFTRQVAPDTVAGILVESIQGEGGYIVPPASFFPRLRQLCDRHGILLICDEVQSGVGRTGKWWAIQHSGVEPDIVACAKGIASGVPLGVMLARASVSTWPPSAHGNTYGGNPLACAAALATLELVEECGLQNAQDTGVYIMERLRQMQTRHNCIGDVRGRGLMIGIDFVEDARTHKPAAALAERVEQLAFEHGLLLLTCGASTVRMAPPLLITRPEVEEGLAIFEHVVGMAAGELG